MPVYAGKADLPVAPPDFRVCPKSVINAHPIGYDMTALREPLPIHLRSRFQKFDPLM
jgi:hypothetical protein